MERQTANGHPLGLHRVVDERKNLPQAAQRLDPNPPLCGNEILLDVTHLQIDSASFAQLKKTHPNEADLKQTVMGIVGERGKMQNPVTGSGGMLLAKIAEIGSSYPDKTLKLGDRIATLISLTATPLRLEAIHAVDFARERLTVKGQAILFEKSLYAKLPADLKEGSALAILDVCGAPAMTVKLARAGQTVFVLGLGKAGRSLIAALRQTYGDSIRILGADPNAEAIAFCQKYYQVEGKSLNAQDPVAVAAWIADKTKGALADVVINTTNVADTEMASILSTREEGTCLFFGMATNFQRAALGAEAAAKDAKLLIGSGYTAGHADFCLNLLRADPVLREWFDQDFG